VLFAQAVIMTKMITLILQGIEGLILYFPSGSGTTHEQEYIVFSDVQISNPAETLNFSGFGILFPVLDKGYPDILV